MKDLADIEVVILGCGYTGERVARRMLARGARVVATSRRPEQLASLAEAGAAVYPLNLEEPASLAGLKEVISRTALALHSVPSLVRPGDELEDPTPRLLEALDGRFSRLVYLSTTGVYGSANQVDENTLAAPASPREMVRYEAEELVINGPWSGLALRPAGIYGPGRGVQASLLAGRYRLPGDGTNYLSRIHVDDLAAHCEAALLNPEIKGAYPVADELPATPLEVVEFCTKLLNLPMPPSQPRHEAPITRQADRKVDGRAIRRLLGIELLYPTYREGIPAALTAS